MLATIRDNTWNVLNMQHIVEAKSISDWSVRAYLTTHTDSH